jgi:phosphoribosylanthranilate isomerase
MTWIKICGITNVEDALVAVEAGADAVGFVFYENSPRCVTVETTREIVARLPEKIEKVGVFVNTPVMQADPILQRAGLTMAQIYQKSMGEWLAWYQNSALKLMLAIPSRALDGDSLIVAGTQEKRFSAVLVDSGNDEQPGGTGRAFDWEDAKTGLWRLEMDMNIPAVIAGGLTPENVGEAIEILRPWGVDVSSGVEAKPGKKDPEKVRAFVKAVREMDRKIS